jgi:hypothetical protein
MAICLIRSKWRGISVAEIRLSSSCAEAALGSTVRRAVS